MGLFDDVLKPVAAKTRAGLFDDVLAPERPQNRINDAAFVPTAPARDIQRTWGEALNDAQLRLRQGANAVTAGAVGIPVDILNMINSVHAPLTGLAPEQQPAAVRGIRESLDIGSDALGERLSAKAKAQAEEFEDVDGFMDTVKYLATNPSFAATEGAAQIPQLMASFVPGGVLGKVAAGSVSAASQNAQQVYEEAKRRGASDADATLASRDTFNLTVPTGAVQYLVPGGRQFERLVSGQLGKSTVNNILGRLGLFSKAAAGETGAEITQESLEQIIQNAALGDPLGRGVGKAGAMGGTLGLGMGATAGAYDAITARGEAPVSNAIDPTPDVLVDVLRRAAAARAPDAAATTSPSADSEVGAIIDALAPAFEPRLDAPTSAEISPTPDVLVDVLRKAAEARAPAVDPAAAAASMRVASQVAQARAKPAEAAQPAIEPASAPVSAAPVEAAPAAAVPLAASADTPPAARMYQRGNGKTNGSVQAIQDDGQWHVRTYARGRWGEWTQRDSFNPTAFDGYRASGTPSGSMFIPGRGRVAVDKTDGEKAKRIYNPLLDLIAGNGGISHADARRQGVDPKSLKDRLEVYPLYSKNGIALDYLREQMIADGYFQLESNDKPSDIGIDEVWDLVSRALDGEPIGPLGDPRMDAERLAKREQDMEDSESMQADEMIAYADEVKADAVQVLRDEEQADIDPADEAEAASLYDLIHKNVVAGISIDNMDQPAGESDRAYAARLWNMYQEATRGTVTENAQKNQAQGDQGREGGLQPAEAAVVPGSAPSSRAGEAKGRARAGVTVADIHALADSKRIPWDNDSAFMDFTESVTGQRHLDALTADQRLALATALAARPASRAAAPGDLFAAPTAREASDALTRARDDRRDGKTGTGRTDMAAGEGELFAGKRPEQAKVPEAKDQPPLTEAIGLHKAHLDGSMKPDMASQETLMGLMREAERGLQGAQRETMREAIALHETHMQRPASATAESQNKMMALMREAQEAKAPTSEALESVGADPLTVASQEPTPELRRLSGEFGEADATSRGLRAAVDKALDGTGIKVIYLLDVDGLPLRLYRGAKARLQQRGGKGLPMGMFDPVTGQVYLFTGALKTPDEAVWTAMHEVAGHKGVRALLGVNLERALRIASQNPTVSAVAAAISGERKLRPDEYLRSIDEALAELSAAVRTGDYAQIKSRYGVSVPISMRNSLVRAIDAFLRRLKAMLNGKMGRDTFSDSQVRELLEASWQAVSRSGGEMGFAQAEAALESVSDPRQGEVVPGTSSRAQAEMRAENKRQEASSNLGIAKNTRFAWTADGSAFVGLEGKRDLAAEVLQDKMQLLYKVQKDIEKQSGEAIPEALNVYEAENLMHDRIGERLIRMGERFIVPNMEALRKGGDTLADLEGYALALNAPYRNARIAKKNPSMPDGAAGITTADAQGIVNGTVANPYTGKVLSKEQITRLKPLIARMQELRRFTLDIMVESEIITPQERARLLQSEPYYVPSKDEIASTFARIGHGKTRSVSGIGNQVTGGRGAGNLPQDIMAHMEAQARNAIMGAETLRLDQKLLAFALKYPNPDFWLVEPVETEWDEDRHGNIFSVVSRPHLFPDGEYKIVPYKGKKYAIKMVNRDLQRVMQSMTPQQLDGIVLGLGHWQRFQSATMVRWNIFFPPINMIRDAGLGSLRAASLYGPGVMIDTALGYGSAAGGLYNALTLGKGDASVADADKTPADWAMEALGEGALIRIADVAAAKKMARDIKREAARVTELLSRGDLTGAGGQALKRSLGHVVEAIEGTNDIIENAYRLSLYIQLRQRGYTKQKAAVAAKDITVNFRRKGSVARTAGAVYIFYNATAQSVNVFKRTMSDPKVLATMAAIGASQALVAWTMMGIDDDDDGVTIWDGLKKNQRERSIIIPFGLLTGDPRDNAFLPIQYGLNMFTYVPTRMAQFIHDKQNGKEPEAMDALKDIRNAILNSFSPIPFDDQGFTAVFGHAMNSVIQIAQNRSDFGRPITPEQPYAKVKKPDALLGRPDSSDWAKSTAIALNKLGGGGGTELPHFESLNVSPQMIEFMTKEALGGVASSFLQTEKFFVRGGTVGYRDNIDILGNAPIFKQFVGKIDDSSAIYERYTSVITRLEKQKMKLADFADAYNGDDVAAAVAKEAGRIGLPGVTVRKYKTSKRASDGKPGYRRGQIMRDADGEVKLETIGNIRLAAVMDAEKAVKQINVDINLIKEKNTAQADIDKVLARHGLEANDRHKVIKALQDNRRLVQQDFLRLMRASNSRRASDDIRQ